MNPVPPMTVVADHNIAMCVTSAYELLAGLELDLPCGAQKNTSTMAVEPKLSANPGITPGRPVL